MTGKKIILLGLLLFLQTILVAQKHDFPVKIDSIKKSHVDTFFLFQHYCVGPMKYQYPKKGTKAEKEIWCQESDDYFVFYKFRGKTYVTKYNKCYKFLPIQLDNSTSFPYFVQHFSELLTDTIKQNGYTTEKGTTAYVMIDHSCFKSIYLSLKQDHFKRVDLFKFKPTSGDEHENINYSFNMNSHFKKFTDLIATDLDSLKFEKASDKKK